MSFSKCDGQSAGYKNFIETLQNDFKNLSQDTRKKYPQIRESCDEAISKLHTAASNQHTSIYYMVNQILYPLVQGCETKDLKIIKFCLGMMQRLITQQVVDQKGAIYITDALWMLMESNIEEVKILQTVTLLLTTNSVVHGDTLSKSLVLCFRLHYSKDSTTANIAGATIRQLVSLVFERVLQSQLSQVALNKLETETNEKSEASTDFSEIESCASDAFLLFQDLVQLVNADQPIWLCGMSEMTRTFGLELIEVILSNFSIIFYESARFTQLLKEQVCALVIKLFSPNIKHRPTPSSGIIVGSSPDKPHFSLSMRLLRVVSVLIQKFHNILVTECEIFLSLIIKFLDLDKPNWQRALALEVIHQMSVKPNLIKFLCKSYDLKDHATKIFQDIVTCLGVYVCNLLKSPTTHNNQLPNIPMVLNSGANLSSPPGFLLNGTWFPLIVTFVPGKSKSTYLEMLDKMEPPSIPDGYGMALAYAILLEITTSVSLIIEIPKKSNEVITNQENNTRKEEDAILFSQLIKSSWSGLLSAFICLLDSATDEGTITRILNAMQDYAALCGILNLLNPRDAFITAICRSSFPPHYALSVLNVANRETDLRCSYKLQGNHEIAQHLAESCNENGGSTLPIALLTVNIPQGPVMLNSKNVQCMKAILNLAHYHGCILGTSWHIVLATLQHLVCILGLKPSTGGSLQISSKPASETNAGIQTAVMADLPVLSQMLNQLFESSQELDDVALHHLIDALCKLSQEAMELAYSNREPSLFAVAKLLEIGHVNMFRVEILWRPLTNHLLEVCQHRHIRMREWGVEAITYLVKVALQYKYDIPLKENMALQTMLLTPFSQLSSVPQGDVRQRQLECVLQILNSSGEILSFGWPVLIEIIGAVNDHQGEPLIRTAFQCLQLVITDFLPVMPWRCLPLCINTAYKFGSQNQELNISLTAIGLMWNISDYFNQNQEKLMQADVGDLLILPDFPGTINIPQFDKLWMCLYARMGDLCVDLRPAVRKSAGQTLFSTISAHGSLLSPQTWQALVWHVMFPLLDKVRSLSSTASNEKVDTSGNILIHHSRNTAQKQWAETHVLILSGVSRVFNSQRNLLQLLGDFSRAWTLILEFIQNAALNKIDEVSLAALKSFQEIMFHNYDTKSECNTENESNLELQIWIEAWKVWLNIGLESINFAEFDGRPELAEEYYIPNQAFLTALVQIFPAIFQHIRTQFLLEDFNKLSNVLSNIIEIPYQSDSVPYLMSSLSDSLLTPLHDVILDCMDLIQKEATKEDSHLTNIIPSIFKQLLVFSKLACIQPSCEETKLKRNINIYSTNTSSMEFSSINYVPFGEKSLNLATKLYQKTAKDDAVITNKILQEILEALRIPLSLKYNCLSASTWKLGISSLFKVLQIGLKVARLKPNYFNEMWDVLADTLDQFLFPTSVCTVEDRGLEEIVLDESIDCQVIEFLKEEILPFSNEIPHQFVIKIVVLLNKGSIHSAAETSMCCESDWKLRELFAKTCFETLLQFSLLDDSKYSSFKGSCEKEFFAGRLAVTALLHRFQEVLKRFNDDERHSGNCPLPRYRLSEISFVLKAIETLITSMKKVPSSKVNKTAWNQIIALYPFIVDCTTTNSPEVSRALRETLLQYTELLQTPLIHNTETITNTK